MLSFISFWRAASIVLCELGSSTYYVGGIAEKAVGRVAPWFVLGIMLFSYAVRTVYIESCSMFIRGGVYKVVREAMRGTAAKFSVSAFLFDYLLTGSISAVIAGLFGRLDHGPLELTAGILYMVQELLGAVAGARAILARRSCERRYSKSGWLPMPIDPREDRILFPIMRLKQGATKDAAAQQPRALLLQLANATPADFPKEGFAS